MGEIYISSKPAKSLTGDPVRFAFMDEIDRLSHREPTEDEKREYNKSLMQYWRDKDAEHGDDD